MRVPAVTAVTAVTVIALLGVGAVLLMRAGTQESAPARTMVQAASQPGGGPAGSVPAQMPDPRAAASPPAETPRPSLVASSATPFEGLEARPEARALRGLMTFQDRLRDFLAAAPTLDRDQRRSGADDLAAEIARMEAAGNLLPAQALLLRVALMRVTAPDEEAYLQQAGALLADASKRNETRRAASEQALVEANAEYRRREARIVAEVMATPELSDPASQQRALRERLQALRTELYQR